MFCKSCGAEIPDDAIRCSQCGNDPHDESNQEIKRVQPEYEFVHAKSRVLAGLLQIFLCFLGAGRFYLGYTMTALLQIFVVIITSGIGVIWPIIDGIMILGGSVATDANGQPLS